MLKQLARPVVILALSVSTLLVAHPAVHVFADAPKYDVSDPEIADFAAHLIVMSEDELPGSGWEVTKRDDFTKTPDPDIQACKDSSGKINALSDKLESNRAGRAKVEITKAGDGSAPPLEVDSDVELFKSNSDLDGFVDAVKPLTLSSNFEKCLQAAISSDLPDAKVKRIDPSTSAPSNGVATAFEVSIPSIKTTLRFEFYGWTDANAAVTLTFSGETKQLTSALIQSAIDATTTSMSIVASLSN